ncbi:MAG: triose-phosphate isomerase [Dehalococcoidia bacterium]|nr:triose-phosphate isomerase [Dehalococcoidia bacterium]
MSNRIPVVAGNWKMNGDEPRALEIVMRLAAADPLGSGVVRVVCPPFVHLKAVANHARGSTILIGAQNCHWEDAGAFTGEVSPAMLAGLVDYVIVGHSERRAYFNETDETVNKKVHAVLRHGFHPIVCVGETADEREAGRTAEVIERQLKLGLEGVELTEGFVIAYEPVWAIGTGVAATPAMANETIGLIRSNVRSLFGAQGADAIRILYGGSVSPANFASIMEQPEIDGGLVGGASLNPDDFNELISIAARSVTPAA